MLVLTRRQKESIKIGDSITITILRVQGQAVRVGIEAPRDVRVVRGELPVAKEIGLEINQQDEVEQASANEPETQVVQFRFSPTKSDTSSRVRGPLAALMATLGTAGVVSEAVAK